MIKKLILTSFAASMLGACGGSDGSGDINSSRTLVGTMVADGYLFDGNAMAYLNARRSQVFRNQSGPAQLDKESWHLCGDSYNGLIAPNKYNLDTDGNGTKETNLTDDKGNLYYNLDLDGDRAWDLNIIGEQDGIALNIDLDCDAKADLNLDTNHDLVADLNIDVDGDLIADRLIDIDGDGEADFSYTESGGVSLAGVTVRIEGQYGSFEAVTDDKGVFKFDRIPDGEYLLSADAKAIDGSHIWTRTQVLVTEQEDSLGAMRMHQDPVVTQVVVNNELTFTGLWNDFLESSDKQVSPGDELTVRIKVEDPNNRPVEVHFSTTLNNEVMVESVDGHVYEYRHTVAASDFESVNWMRIYARLDNGDGFHGLDGYIDAYADVRFNAGDWWVEPEDIRILSATVGSESFKHTIDHPVMDVYVTQPLAIDGMVDIAIEVEGPSDRTAEFHYATKDEFIGETIHGDAFTFDASKAQPRYTYQINYVTYTDFLSERDEVMINIPLDTDSTPANVEGLSINGVAASQVMARVGDTASLTPEISNIQGDIVECKFMKSGNHNVENGHMIRDWGDCSAVYQFLQEDAVSEFAINVYVRNSDGIVTWDDYDDLKWYPVAVTQ